MSGIRGKWKKTIPIKQHLEAEEDLDAPEIIKRARAIANEFKTALPVNMFDIGDDMYDGVLCEAVEYLEDFNMEMNHEKMIDTFDNILEDLYEWGDENRYWLG